MQGFARNCRNQSLRCQGRSSSGEQPQGESPDAEHWGGPIRIVRWAAHELGGLKSLRRSDEGRCIQRRG